ncbi:unnamed protein product [Periconia digitata]|uniref:Protection of telomeres protein 1 ssDNA-binding domain-containing protein n=1 Tax=Periconia digitata TaxID=1303443 RepID=A0A9W4UU51_9PLEO|nr:unnamed protein product [Periconia digitata]
MASGLSGFSPIKDAKSVKDGGSFLGVIVEINPPHIIIQKDKDPQYTLEFAIQDHFSANPDAQSRLKCRLKRGSEARLPKGAVGDIAILRKMRMIEYNGQPLATNAAYLASEVTFIPAHNIPSPTMGTPFIQGGTSKLGFEAMLDSKGPTPSEQAAAIDMKASVAAYLPMFKRQTTATIPTGPKSALNSRNPYPYPNPYQSNSTPNRSSFNKKKQVLIRDIEPMKFYNLVGEVVKIFSERGTDLYITDYTENAHLYHYPDPKDHIMAEGYGNQVAQKWPGPYGQLTLMVHLWDDHADAAQESLQEGDIAYLQNVRIKISPQNIMEGTLNQDTKYPNRRCVFKCADPTQLDAVKQRKRAYQMNRDSSPALVPQPLPSKPSVKPSTKSTKKEEKKQRNKLQKELEQQELEARVRRQEMNQAGLNNNVRAGNSEHALSTVKEIVHNKARERWTDDGFLRMPFVNCRYRVHLRIVDFWPMDLTQFSKNLGDANFNTKATPEQRQKSRHKWEWDFVLLVEDGATPARNEKERIPLLFGNAQGQNLLQMDACDLANNPNILHKLEEKMFIMWGNLQERKIALWKEKKIRLPLSTDDPQLQLNNLPFECCLEEYGEAVGAYGEATDWIRRYSPFNTTIY